MGKLAKDLENSKSLNTSRTHTYCSVGKFVLTLDEDDRRAFISAMNDPKIQVVAISRALDKNDIHLGYDVLARHRRRAKGGGCRCPADQ